MTLLIDIDHVILTWDDYVTTPYNGFDDYVKPGKRFFSRYSPEQLQMIHDRFETIYWHTTWSQTDMANQYFCPETGFCVRENLIDNFGGPVRHLPPDVVHDCRRANWFKLDAVALWLESGVTERFVWVDDQLYDTWHRGVKAVLEYYGATERCLAIAPEDGWTRSSIVAADEWLKSDEPGHFQFDPVQRG